MNQLSETRYIGGFSAKFHAVRPALIELDISISQSLNKLRYYFQD